MKKNSFIGFVLAISSLAFSTTSCSDMLSPDMSGRAEVGAFGQDSVYSYFGILKSIQDIAERQVILGECRGDLVSTTEYTTDSIGNIANFNKPIDGSNALLSRASYYKIINQCNIYLNNVDTAITKNGLQYMKKEYAQVVTMRAWTYMQLVQNYGRVPFITKPVTNSNTGWEKNPPLGFVEGPSDLLEKLESDNSITKAYQIFKQTGYPSYGTYKTGAVDIAASMCMIPTELVLADLYLLRGASQQDFAQAASLYYTYLKQVGKVYSDRIARFSIYKRYQQGSDVPKIGYTASGSNWISSFSTYSKGEVISLIPSAANSSLGTVLKRVQNVYGYETTSSQTTVADEEQNSSSTTTATTTGSIHASINKNYRQLQSSNGLELLSKAQTYLSKDINATSSEAMAYYNCGDARLQSSLTDVTYINNNLRTELNFIKKFTSGGFYYGVQTYRASLVYLRLAEAINRAGFPEFAFGILRNGLTNETLPTLADSVRIDSVRIGDKIVYTKETVYYIDTIAAKDKMYATVGELRRAAAIPWLDFSDAKWKETCGIHGLGSGDLSDKDTMFTYKKMVAQKIANEQKRLGKSEAAAKRYAARVMRQTEGGEEGEEPGFEDITKPAAKANAEEINAVEDLIVDELALETAYEGNRYFDLMRIASHKNNNDNLLNGFDNPNGVSYGTTFGTEWFAWKIARRNLTGLISPYDQPTQKDGTIFAKLMVPANWYLPNPVY